MSAFGKFRGGAVAGAVALTTLFAAPACAQEKTTTSSAVTVENGAPVSGAIEFVEDADYAADEYVVNNPDRFAISVRVGAQSMVPLENIEIILRRDFEANGITNINFYWETGGPRGTTVAFHSDIYVSDPYGLDTARDHVANAARRALGDRNTVFAQQTN